MLCLSFLCFPSLLGGFYLFFLLPATKGSEAGGGRDPPGQSPHRTLGGDSVSRHSRTGRDVLGSVRGGAGMETCGADPYGGATGSQPPLEDPHFLIGFQWDAGPGGLSPAALVTGMEPCECTVSPPGWCQGGSQPPSTSTPSASSPGVRLAQQGMAGGAFSPPLPAVPTAKQGPDTSKKPRICLKTPTFLRPERPPCPQLP